MLDFFLVLGQIPGTNFDLTFNEIFLGVLIFTGVFAWKSGLIILPSRPVEREVIQLSSLHSFSYPAIQPVQSTDHKSLDLLVNAWRSRLSQALRLARQFV